MVRQGYKQTEVGEIPEDWELSTIGENTIWKSGGTPSRDNEEYWNGSIPWISGSTLKSSEIFTSDQFLTEEAVSNGSKMAPLSSTLILVRGSALHNEIRAGLVVAPVCFNQDVKALIPVKAIDPKYLTFYILGMKDELLKLVSSAGNSAGVLDTELVKNFKFLVPELDEQKAIAKALSDVDALIISLEKLIAKKRDIKTATMQQLLTGKKRLPGFGEAWEETTFGEIVEKIVGGGTPSRSNASYWGNEIPWVTVKDFSTFNPRGAQEYITSEGIRGSSTNLIPRGHVIISTRMAIGKPVIYEVDVCINQDMKAIFLKSDVLSKYVYYWFQHYEDSIATLSGGSTVKGLSLPDLRKHKFSKPSTDEQKAIVKILSDIDQELCALGGQLKKTKAIKQGMMQELLTGRTRLVDLPVASQVA